MQVPSGVDPSQHRTDSAGPDLGHQTAVTREEDDDASTHAAAYTGPFEPAYLICPCSAVPPDFSSGQGNWYPPRTVQPTHPGLLRSLMMQLPDLAELEEEKLGRPVFLSTSLRQSCPSPIEGPYCISLSDCIPGIGSNVGARDWEFWRRESGCTGRIGRAEEGGVLSVGPHSHVQENAAHRSGRGLTRGDDDKRHLRHRIPGEVSEVLENTESLAA